MKYVCKQIMIAGIPLLSDTKNFDDGGERNECEK